MDGLEKDAPLELATTSLHTLKDYKMSTTTTAITLSPLCIIPCEEEVESLQAIFLERWYNRVQAYHDIQKEKPTCMSKSAKKRDRRAAGWRDTYFDQWA